MNTTIKALDVKVGRRIRERRLIAGLSLEETAEALGITTTQQHRYETGERAVHVHTLIALSSILGFRMEDIFDGMNGHDQTVLTRDAIQVAKMIDGLSSVGRRHTIKTFIAKLAAWDKDGDNVR